jgi:hypothetical protein
MLQHKANFLIWCLGLFLCLGLGIFAGAQLGVHDLKGFVRPAVLICIATTVLLCKQLTQSNWKTTALIAAVLILYMELAWIPRFLGVPPSS